MTVCSISHDAARLPLQEFIIARNGTTLRGVRWINSANFAVSPFSCIRWGTARQINVNARTLDMSEWSYHLPRNASFIPFVRFLCIFVIHNIVINNICKFPIAAIFSYFLGYKLQWFLPKANNFSFHSDIRSNIGVRSIQWSTHVMYSLSGSLSGSLPANIKNCSVICSDASNRSERSLIKFTNASKSSGSFAASASSSTPSSSCSWIPKSFNAVDISFVSMVPPPSISILSKISRISSSCVHFLIRNLSSYFIKFSHKLSRYFESP